MEVKPFKAFRFDAGMVGDVGSCIAPPYDVISPSRQQQLYKKSEYNIVRIIKGKTAPFDNADNNQYTRAADYLDTWIKKGVLKQDPAEAIYPYVQDFQLSGCNFRRSSFVALAELEEFGKIVRPHEQTLQGPKIDRLNLKRATVAKFGLVFMLYEDEQNVAEKIIEETSGQKPLIDFVDEQNVRHRLFAITAEEYIDGITKMMLDKSSIIADGHHRYETALNYYKETGNPAAAYQMSAFVNIRQKGLTILATHRLIGGLENFHLEKLITALRENFEITEYAFDSTPDRAQAKQKIFAQMKSECDNDRNVFGIYGGSNAFYMAVLKNEKAVDSAVLDMSRPWSISEEKLAGGSNVEYIKDVGSAVDESIEKVDSGQKQVVFFVNPTKMQQIQMVTAAGERMPQKSTFFYPKMHTGLTINKL
jgi:uncharacterized protein (DUF1015 family)